MVLRSLALAAVVAFSSAACGPGTSHQDAAADVPQRDVQDVQVTCAMGDPMLLCYVGARNRACNLEQTFPPSCIENRWQCAGNFVSMDVCGCTAYGSVMAKVECPCSSYGPPPNNMCPTDGGTPDAGPTPDADSSPDAGETDAAVEAGTTDAG